MPRRHRASAAQSQRVSSPTSGSTTVPASRTNTSGAAPDVLDGLTLHEPDAQVHDEVLASIGERGIAMISALCAALLHHGRSVYFLEDTAKRLRGSDTRQEVFAQLTISGDLRNKLAKVDLKPLNKSRVLTLLVGRECLAGFVDGVRGVSLVKWLADKLTGMNIVLRNSSVRLSEDAYAFIGERVVRLVAIVIVAQLYSTDEAWSIEAKGDHLSSNLVLSKTFNDADLTAAPPSADKHHRVKVSVGKCFHAHGFEGTRGAFRMVSLNLSDEAGQLLNFRSKKTRVEYRSMLALSPPPGRAGTSRRRRQPSDESWTESQDGEAVQLEGGHETVEAVREDGNDGGVLAQPRPRRRRASRAPAPADKGTSTRPRRQPLFLSSPDNGGSPRQDLVETRSSISRAGAVKKSSNDAEDVFSGPRAFHFRAPETEVGAGGPHARAAVRLATSNVRRGSDDACSPTRSFPLADASARAPPSGLGISSIAHAGGPRHTALLPSPVSGTLRFGQPSGLLGTSNSRQPRASPSSPGAHRTRGNTDEENVPADARTHGTPSRSSVRPALVLSPASAAREGRLGLAQETLPCLPRLHLHARANSGAPVAPLAHIAASVLPTSPPSPSAPRMTLADATSAVINTPASTQELDWQSSADAMQQVGWIKDWEGAEPPHWWWACFSDEWQE